MIGSASRITICFNGCALPVSKNDAERVHVDEKSIRGNPADTDGLLIGKVTLSVVHYRFPTSSFSAALSSRQRDPCSRGSQE